VNRQIESRAVGAHILSALEGAVRHLALPEAVPQARWQVWCVQNGVALSGDASVDRIEFLWAYLTAHCDIVSGKGPFVDCFDGKQNGVDALVRVLGRPLSDGCITARLDRPFVRRVDIDVAQHVTGNASQRVLRYEVSLGFDLAVALASFFVSPANPGPNGGNTGAVGVQGHPETEFSRSVGSCPNQPTLYWNVEGPHVLPVPAAGRPAMPALWVVPFTVAVAMGMPYLPLPFSCKTKEGEVAVPINCPPQTLADMRAAVCHLTCAPTIMPTLCTDLYESGCRCVAHVVAGRIWSLVHPEKQVPYANLRNISLATDYVAEVCEPTRTFTAPVARVYERYVRDPKWARVIDYYTSMLNMTLDQPPPRDEVVACVFYWHGGELTQLDEKENLQLPAGSVVAENWARWKELGPAGKVPVAHVGRPVSERHCRVIMHFMSPYMVNWTGAQPNEHGVHAAQRLLFYLANRDQVEIGVNVSPRRFVEKPIVVGFYTTKDFERHEAYLAVPAYRRLYVREVTAPAKSALIDFGLTSTMPGQSCNFHHSVAETIEEWTRRMSKFADFSVGIVVKAAEPMLQRWLPDECNVLQNEGTVTRRRDASGEYFAVQMNGGSPYYNFTTDITEFAHTTYQQGEFAWTIEVRRVMRTHHGFRNVFFANETIELTITVGPGQVENRQWGRLAVTGWSLPPQAAGAPVHDAGRDAELSAVLGRPDSYAVCINMGNELVWIPDSVRAAVETSHRDALVRHRLQSQYSSSPHHMLFERGLAMISDDPEWAKLAWQYGWAAHVPGPTWVKKAALKLWSGRDEITHRILRALAAWYGSGVLAGGLSALVPVSQHNKWRVTTSIALMALLVRAATGKFRARMAVGSASITSHLSLFGAGGLLSSLFNRSWAKMAAAATSVRVQLASRPLATLAVAVGLINGDLVPLVEEALKRLPLVGQPIGHAIGVWEFVRSVYFAVLMYKLGKKTTAATTILQAPFHLFHAYVGRQPFLHGVQTHYLWNYTVPQYMHWAMVLTREPPMTREIVEQVVQPTGWLPVLRQVMTSPQGEAPPEDLSEWSDAHWTEANKHGDVVVAGVNSLMISRLRSILPSPRFGIALMMELSRRSRRLAAQATRAITGVTQVAQGCFVPHLGTKVQRFVSENAKTCSRLARASAARFVTLFQLTKRRIVRVLGDRRWVWFWRAVGRFLKRGIAGLQRMHDDMARQAAREYAELQLGSAYRGSVTRMLQSGL
jgi:hypothetical protein